MALFDEWIEKAEADLRAAASLARPRKEPVPDIVCYLYQQSAEKYLKAYLIARGSAPPHTHDMQQLVKYQRLKRVGLSFYLLRRCVGRGQEAA